MIAGAGWNVRICQRSLNCESLWIAYIQGRPNHHDKRLGVSIEPKLASRNSNVIIGNVVTVSADRLVDRYSQIPYYLARIEVSKDELAKLEEAKLQPGMPVDVLIKTGSRTELSYMIGPIKESLARSFREK